MGRSRSPSPGHSASKRSRYGTGASSNSSSRRDDRDYADRRQDDRHRDSSHSSRDRRDRDYDRDRDHRRRGPDDRERERDSSYASSSSRRRDDRSVDHHAGQDAVRPVHSSSSSSRPRSDSRDRGGYDRSSSSRYSTDNGAPSSSRHGYPSQPPPPPAAPKGPTPEELAEAEKQRKREKLAAWKAQQAAKKATNGGSPAAAAISIPGSASPAPPSAVGTPLSLKPSTSNSSTTGTKGFALPTKGAPTRLGLPLKTGLLSMRGPASTLKPSKLGGSALLDDTDTSVRKLEKLGDLPEVDMAIVPSAEVSDEDEGELEKEWVASVGGGRRGDEPQAQEGIMDVDQPVASTSNGSTPAPTPASSQVPAEGEDEDEDEDPLDAYMRSVNTTRTQVDKEDQSRTASGAPKPRKLGLDDDVAGEEDDDEEGGEDDNKEDGPLTAEDIMAMAAKRNRRKDLAPVDHSKATYEPFRKAFYTPPYEVAQMTEEEVELMRLEMDGIKIRGLDCPRPVKRWGAFGLPGGCLEIIKRLGYTAPTAIQAQAIPAIMSGRDVIGVAKTGSGKTIAFLLPLLRHIKDQRPLQTGEGPMAVVMTPTRELALQIVREAKPFCKVLNITAMCAYGGSPISEQIAEMKKGAELVVCTPGRMLDLLTANSGRVTNLKRVTYMVLDEADRMFDMGFEPQVMKIINNVRPDRQVVLFSATFPKQMDALARKLLVKPLEVTVGGRSVVAKEITQVVEVRPEETKFHRLLELLGETYQTEADLDEKRTLVFVERQEAADNLLLELHQRSYRRANSLHGGKEQVDRDQTLTNFKSGVIPIVIATSVAARGLDVKQLGLVINYDVPNHMEDYVHRAGRTGRAGNKGTCVTFITPEQEKYSVDICRAVEASGVTPPAELKKLSDGFLTKVRSGTAKSHSGTGFGGKGLDKFESEREAKDKAERAAFGEDEKPKKDDAGKDADGEGGSKPSEQTKDEKHVLGSFKVDIVKGPAPERVNAGPGRAAIVPPQPVAPPPLKLSGNTAGLSKVEAALAKINAELDAKRRAMKAGASGPGGGGGPSAAPSGSTGDTGGAQRTQIPDNRKPKDPDATDFHAVVQINDFIQKARWLVTNRDSMTKLIDLSGCAITNRGIYYPPGVDPPPGAEPKLALLVESNDEWRVELAVKEITRLLVEGTVIGMAQEQRAGAGGGGRYSVV